MFFLPAILIIWQIGRVFSPDIFSVCSKIRVIFGPDFLVILRIIRVSGPAIFIIPQIIRVYGGSAGQVDPPRAASPWLQFTR